MNALDQHGRNMKRMINNVSQELGPRKGIEAVKARQELNKVAETNEENNIGIPGVIDGRGRGNKDVGRIIRKIYQKRNGEKVIKYFYVSQKNPDFKIVLCGIYEYLSHLVNKPNRLVSIEWKGMGTPGGSHPNSPCTSPVELQMKEYVEPEKEDVDDWWDNEITDEELDEVTGAGSAGAFVAPMGWNNDTGMSKEINEYDEEEVGLDEYTSSASSGAYTTPFGWDSKGKTTHNHHSHNYPDQDFLMRVKNDQELDEMTSSSSSGSYSQPAIWAKNKQNWRAVSDPNFPRYGGPGGKYVKIKEKCRHFPYCNQGDINALEFYEEKTLKEAIKNVSKKTNKSENYIKNIILQEMESMFKQDMKKFQTSKMKPYKKKKKSKKKYSKKEVDEMIKRGFYHSPITSLVGNVKMNKPIGQIYSMKGNKPKYE